MYRIKRIPRTLSAKSGCSCGEKRAVSSDPGSVPYVINIDQAAIKNNMFRSAVWTGKTMQATLMSIPAGGEIGLEMHECTDQFLKIVQGVSSVRMGRSCDCLGLQTRVSCGNAIFIPAGTWHNIVNLGEAPLKLYSVYAPPHHPCGIVHATRADAEKTEK